MKLSEMLKRKYRSFAENRMVASLFFSGYFFVQKFQNKECKKCPKNNEPYGIKQMEMKKSLEDLCVATICDDMTWQNLKQECQVYSLTPHNWKNVFYEKRPGIFFCESAWVGLKEQGNCWHGKIYKNKRLLFENRKELLDILQFCKKHNIPTIFWNKEDPAFFENERYDFVSTALEFDYIFTTASECVAEYQKRGHSHVGVLPFGFSPYLFNPLNCYPKENVAVFAGSWYEEEKERCQALTAIFADVIARGIQLVIYDRQTGTCKEGREFPERYQQYIQPAIPFEELGRILKKSKYAINVNSITDSETMFARRVFEVMAVNTMVISNESVGMRKKFRDNVWFVKEAYDENDIQEKCLKNLEHAFTMRTNQKLFSEMFQKIGVLEEQKAKRIVVFDTDRQQKEQGEFDYGFFWDGKSNIPDFEKVLPHFCYLPQGCGIKVSAEKEFVIQENSDNVNVLFPRETCSLILEHPETKTQKYYLGVSAK